MFKLQVQEDDKDPQAWHDVHGPDGKLLTFEKETEARARFEAALNAYQEAKAAGSLTAQEFKQLDAKMSKIQAALAEGKYGRAKGLSTAIQAKSKNSRKHPASSARHLTPQEIHIDYEREYNNHPFL